MSEPIFIFDHVAGKIRTADTSQGTLRLMDPESLCPDLLSLDYLGPADHWRGRVVRAFFWLMRAWRKPRARP